MLGHSKPLQIKNRDKLLNHIHNLFLGQVRFGLTPVHSPLLRRSLLISFPPPTQMFPFGGFTIHKWIIKLPIRQFDRKSHSGILGSKAACAYPRLIAAYHALHNPSSLAIHQKASLHRDISYNAYALQEIFSNS